MALRLLKLFVGVSGTVTGGATANTTTAVTPVATRYIATVTSGMVTTGTTTIPVGSFEDDTGATATALPTGGATNTYMNVYINGVLQQKDLTTITATSLRIGAEVLAGVPVVIENVSTNATSTSTVDVSGLVISTTAQT